MTHYNCGGPDSPGGTHFTACSCQADRLEQQGVLGERRRIVEWLESLGLDYPRWATVLASSIRRGEHLRGESEGG